MRPSGLLGICLLAACTTAPHPDEAAIKKAEQQRENIRSFLESRQREIRERTQQTPDSVYLHSIDSFITKTLDSINRLPPL